MSTRKIYEIEYQLKAQMDSAFGGNFAKAQQSITAIQNEIKGLHAVQNNITSYERQQKAIEKTQGDIETYKKQLENVQGELEATGNKSSLLENEKLRLGNEIKRVEGKLAEQQERLGKTGAALEAAGVNTGVLGEASAQAAKKIEDLKNEQEKAAEKADSLGRKTAEAASAMQQALVAAGIVTLVKQVGDAFTYCVNAASEFELGMVGVEKTTDLTARELASMSEEIKELSRIVPMAASELAVITSNAGQLGIEKDNLTEFTRIMADLGVATNLTGEEAAQTFAKFANITGMSQKEFGALGSTVVALGNNLATTERDIAAMATRLASAGRQAGMSEADILGVAGALSSVGLEAQAGGTAFTKAINQITIAVETGNDDLEEFARIAGMSAHEFASAWGDDAAGALLQFTSGLSDVERHGASAVVLLDELGMKEVRLSDAMRRAAGAGELFARSLDLANTSWEENNALAKEAELFYGATTNQVKLLQNEYDLLKVAIGDALLPAYQDMLAAGQGTLEWLTEYIEKNPAAVKAATAFAGVMGTVVAALTGYTVVTKIATAVAAAFNIALGPVMWIATAVAGVAALTAAFVHHNKELGAAEREYKALSITSREQYDEMKELEEEYARVSDAMGETSAEAQLLKKELDDATEAFEENKQTIEEAAEAHRAMLEAYKEYNSSWEARRYEHDREAESTHNLIARLRELSDITERTSEQQQEYLTIIGLLNERMPSLELTYDAYRDSLSMALEQVEALAEAEARRDKDAVLRAEHASRIERRDELQRQRAAALEEIRLAEQRVEREKRELARVQEEDYFIVGAAMEEYHENVKEAEAAVKDLETAYRSAANEYTANERKIIEQAAALNANAEELENCEKLVKEHALGLETLDGALATTEESLRILEEAYLDAYEAALQSVSGQYELWDKAAKVTATSVSTMNSALESQVKYWQDYNANLEMLSGMTGDVEGLSEVIASFADGSQESVNAIAGMAKAAPEELDKMVKAWQEVQAEQEATAAYIRDFAVDLEGGVDSIIGEYERMIEGIELSDEAAAAAAATIEAYVGEVDAKTEAVRAAFAEIAAVARAAMGMAPIPPDMAGDAAVIKGRGIHGSHADGLPYVPFDNYIALLHEGERVMTAEQNAAFYSMHPALLSALESQHSSHSEVNASINNAGHAGTAGTVVSFGDINITAGSTLSVEDCQELKGLIIDTAEEYIAEKERDAARRIYV